MSVEKEVTYKVNGQRIHAIEEGPVGGQIALMIHGWSSSWYAVSPLIPVLKRLGYRCIAVDLPGFGESPSLPARVTIDDYTDLLAELLRGVTDAPAVLVGHSMGGMISLTMSIRYPELVERMILIDPTISGHLSLYINLFISPVTLLERVPVLDFISGKLKPLLMNLTDQLLRDSQFASKSNELTEDQLARLRTDARATGQGKVRAQCYWAMRDHDLRGRLADIRQPALVFWGLEDNTVPLRDASALAQEMDADMRFIPNAGHWPHFERRSIVEKYVLAFLRMPMNLLNLESKLQEMEL